MTPTGRESPNEERAIKTDRETAPVSKSRIWAGSIMSLLPAGFLLFDGVMKLAKPEVVVKATVELGYAERVIVPLGMILIACTVLYLIPRTVGLGAILLTGYLGGVVATHVRVGAGWLPIAFPFSWRRCSGQGWSCGTDGCAT